MVRFKYRYFVVKMSFISKKLYISKPVFLKREIIGNSIRNKIKELHGDYGVGAVDFGLRVKYCNPYTQILLVRAQHGAHRFVASALPFVKNINLDSVTLSTLYTGGTIRKCFAFVQRYQKNELKKRWHLFKEEDKPELEKAFMDINWFGDKSKIESEKTVEEIL